MPTSVQQLAILPEGTKEIPDAGGGDHGAVRKINHGKVMACAFVTGMCVCVPVACESVLAFVSTVYV